MTTADHETVYADDMDLATVRGLLSTTRAVRRRLDLDRPVDRQVVEECLELAAQAPCAGARQQWRWYIVTEPDRKQIIADYMRSAWVAYNRTRTNSRRSQRSAGTTRRSLASAQWLVDNIQRIPMLVIPCMMGRPYVLPADTPWDPADPRAVEVRQLWLQVNSTFYGSVFPMIWSLQLALRSRGLGSTISTVQLLYHDLLAWELGIPRAATQIALIPVAHTLGTGFRPAEVPPARGLTIWDSWMSPHPDPDLRARVAADVASGRAHTFS